jgi:hypothetical protein
LPDPISELCGSIQWIKSLSRQQWNKTNANEISWLKAIRGKAGPESMHDPRHGHQSDADLFRNRAGIARLRSAGLHAQFGLAKIEKLP